MMSPRPAGGGSPAAPSSGGPPPSFAMIRARPRRAALFLALVVASPVEARQKAPSMAGRSTVYAPHAIIATSQPLATSAGLAVLQRGGNAVDAAVTAAAVLNLVEPHMTGMGGDVFALLWSARERRLWPPSGGGRPGPLMPRAELGRRAHPSVPLYGPEPITV